MPLRMTWCGAIRLIFSPAEMHVAAHRIEHARNGLQGAGLAGAVGADQRHRLAFVDVEGDAAHRLDAAIGDVESGYFKHLGKPR